MPKALCWAGMVMSILVLLLFITDLVAPSWLAPFKKASLMMDIAFALCAATTAYMSYATLREQG